MPSISAAKPAVTITIDRARRVRYTWDAANRFEEAFGKTLPEAMYIPLGSTRLITHIVWAGLLHEEPTLQVPDASRRLQTFLNNGGDINALSTAFMKALIESGIMGKAAENKSEEQEGEASQDPPQAVPAE